jgi:methionyl-tRNA formyltransferase
MSDAYRVLIFLNGNRGLRVLSALASSQHEIVGVVWHGENIEVDSIRRVSGPQTPILKVTVGQWGPVEDLAKTLNPDVGVVAGFSFLVPQALFEYARFGFVNLHAGALPKYRGGSPLNWQLINGEPIAGVSVLEMTCGLDDGRVVGSDEIPIGEFDTIKDLHEMAESCFIVLISQILDNLPSALANALPQSEADACYWHQRSDADGRIRVWQQSAVEVERMVRALTFPYPGAWVERSGEMIRLFEVRIPRHKYSGTPGRVVRLKGENPILILREGSLELMKWNLPLGVKELANGDFIT